MIVITGASHGVGEYLFKKYETAGESVFGTCWKNVNSKLDKVDISSYESVRRWADLLIERGLHEITLINCAAISYDCFAHKADPRRWEEVIRTNLLGSFWTIECFLPVMRNQMYGRIINFSSVTAQRGVLGTSAYAASKSALWGMAKSIAQENAAKGITINSINLGYSDIGLGKDAIDSRRREELLNCIPAGRFCMPEEIYNTVQYIRSTAYLNGIALDLSGGLV